jgi:hypothetical protein
MSRAPRALKALQVQPMDETPEVCDAPNEPGAPELAAPAPDEQPIEPEPRKNPGETAPAAAADQPRRASGSPPRAPPWRNDAPPWRRNAPLMRHSCGIIARRERQVLTSRPRTLVIEGRQTRSC